MGRAGNLSLVDRDRALAAGDLPAAAWSAHLLRVAAEEVGAGPVANTALGVGDARVK